MVIMQLVCGITDPTIYKNFNSSSPHQMDQSRSKMSELPSELLRDILARMTLEDLMLLRCVCSSWRNVIDCRTFVVQHIMSSSASSTPKLILSSTFGCYKLSFEQIAPSTTPGNEPIPGKVVRIMNPITPGHSIICLNNSNNGLVLLIDQSKRKFIMWNPFTRQHLKLPVSHPFENGMGYRIGVGFGVDEVSKDCKFVLIWPHFDSSPDMLVYKLRMKSDNCSTSGCWKRMEHLPVLGLAFPNHSVGGVFVSGALHWIVHREHFCNNSSLLVVDLGTESYRLMPFPPAQFPQADTNLCLLGGCLCVTFHGSNKFEAWVMKEYGVVESWSRLYVVPYDRLGVKSIGKATPVAYSNCGSWVLLSFGSGLVWYHLLNKSAKLIKLQGWRRVREFTATVYAGSLFPLDWDTTKPRKPPTTVQRKRKSR